MTIDIVKEAKSIQDLMIKWRRDLHQIPEIGLELPQTVAYLKGELDKMGIQYDASLVDGNAIVGLIEGTKEEGLGRDEERVLALRADTDANPLAEDTGLEFASTNGNIHGCGHDGHMAMLLGAAKILQENRHLFSGTVKLLFQPGEEFPGGAEPMIKEGCMENPKVTRVMGFHNGQISADIPSGYIGYSTGKMMASMDRFQIDINGKGNHGAYPEGANDPIMAAAQIMMALQTIKSRNVTAFNPFVLSITRVEGGFNQNILPDKVELEGTVRTYDDELRKFIHQKIEQISQNIGIGMGVECDVTYEYKYPAVVNDHDATLDMVDSIRELFPDKVMELDEPVMGGEDFSFYLYEAPGAFFFLSNPSEIEGEFHGHHHPKFNIDESLFYMGTASFVKVALDYLN